MSTATGLSLKKGDRVTYSAWPLFFLMVCGWIGLVVWFGLVWFD
jgi:hypothetical protein